MKDHLSAVQAGNRLAKKQICGKDLIRLSLKKPCLTSELYLALDRSLEPPYIPSNPNYTVILWPMIWKKFVNLGSSKLSVQQFWGVLG